MCMDKYSNLFSRRVEAIVQMKIIVNISVVLYSEFSLFQLRKLLFVCCVLKLGIYIYVQGDKIFPPALGNN